MVVHRLQWTPRRIGVSELVAAQVGLLLLMHKDALSEPVIRALGLRRAGLALTVLLGSALATTTRYLVTLPSSSGVDFGVLAFMIEQREGKRTSQIEIIVVVAVIYALPRLRLGLLAPSCTRR